MARSVLLGSGKVWHASGRLYNDPIFGINPGDRPPLAPSTYDDEFEDASIDSKWSWLNQGTATISEALGYSVLTAPGTSGDQVRGRIQAAPSTSTAFTMSAKMRTAALNQNFVNSGIIVYNSGNGRLISCSIDQGGGWRVSRWNSASSFSADIIGANTGVSQIPEYFRIVFDGSTTFSFYFSRDGQSWIKHATTETLAAFISSFTSIGFYCDMNNTSYTAIADISWFRVTTP